MGVEDMKTAKKVIRTLYVKCPYCGMYGGVNISYAGSKYECLASGCCKTFRIPKLKDIK